MKPTTIYQKISKIINRTLFMMLLTSILSLAASGKSFSDYRRLFEQQQAYASYENTLIALEDTLQSYFNGTQHSQQELLNLAADFQNVSLLLPEYFPHAQFVDTQLLAAVYLERVTQLIEELPEKPSSQLLASFDQTETLYNELLFQYQTTETVQKELMDLKADQINRRWLFQIPLILAMIIFIYLISFHEGHQTVKRIVQPLTSLTSTADRISSCEGQEFFPPDDLAPDTAQEICLLTAAFRHMSETISRQMEELKEKIVLAEKLHGLEIQNMNMKMLLAHAEMSQFQSLINPHFLFNCLSMLSSSALVEKAPKTYEYSLSIAQFLRSSLNLVGKIITVREEVLHIRHYADIQKQRFRERITFIITCDPDCENVMLPAIILQPLVENALVHGVASYPSGGLIRVSVRKDQGRVRLSVEDNGPGMSPEQIDRLLEDFSKPSQLAPKKTGLYGAVYSMRCYFQENAEVKIENHKMEHQDSGLRVSFFFPPE